RVLPLPLGPLVGVATVTNEGSDVLIANWRFNDSLGTGVRGLWIWDTPEYNWFVIKCDAERFKSAASTESFLNQVLQWQSEKTSPLVLQLRYTLAMGQTFL